MQEMQEIAFLILMHMEDHDDEAKTRRLAHTPFCILEVINKFSDILMDDLLTILPPNRYVDHRIEVHPRFSPSIKAP